ncbi:MAG TPA: ATP-binding protein [Gaiellaceae bacterium]|nr:ATP-binding protein [Gaiellaceae bacterium]
MTPAPTNPFHFGDLALDESFTDRAAELKALKADIRNGQNVAVIAPRRYGKSSLVRRAIRDLTRRGVLVAEVDLMKTPTKAKLAAKLARAIHTDIASTLFKAKDALRVFANLRITPTITLDPDEGTYSFTFAAYQAEEDLDATLERLLELPAQLAAERGKTVALFFDEFQEVVGIDPRLPALMRAVFQEQPQVAHVYAGSKRDMMRRLFTDEHEPFYKSARVLELGPIDPAHFEGFVRERFAATEKGIANAAAAGILAITRGHPHATQELAYALWEEVPHGFTATEDDLARALASVLRSENAHFTLLWQNASRAQRLVLQALAAEPGRPLGTEYRTRFGLPPASTVQRALEALVGNELVERRDDGSYAIAEPFLTEWVVRHGS